MIDKAYEPEWIDLVNRLDDPEVPGEVYSASLAEMIEELESRLAAALDDQKRARK